MRVTLRDIAARLKLSVATVSRSLARREDPFISQATRERVVVCAEEMGYQANRAARALATGSTRMIGLRVAHFFEYYLQVAVHLQREVERDGWRLLICQGWDDQPWPTDGDVHLEAPLGAPAPRPPARKPAVSLAQDPTVDHVSVDLYGASRAAMDHLLATGAKRIAYLASPISLGLGGRGGDGRWRAYQDAMLAIGGETERIDTDAHSRGAARAAVLAHARRRGGPPDAIFCHNDELALGAYRGLIDLGLRLPEDVQLIGCDGLDQGEYLDSPLSTIVMPIAAQCQLAWQYLRRRLERADVSLQKRVLEGRLELRGTTRPSPRSRRVAVDVATKRRVRS